MFVIFPMSDSIFTEKSDYPKPFYEIDNKILIELSIEKFLDFPDVVFNFVIKEDDLIKLDFEKVIKLAVKGRPYNIYSVERKTSGALCSALVALGHNDVNTPIIITNFDHILKFNLWEKIKKSNFEHSDYTLFTFRSIHPIWSFIDYDSKDKLIHISEKKPISENALAGIYLFNDKNSFLELSEKALIKKFDFNQPIYISNLIKEYILNDMKCNLIKIKKENYFKITQYIQSESMNRI